MKYIVIDLPPKLAIVFDDAITHYDVARNFVLKNVTSAGFCTIDVIKKTAHTHGNSVTLNLESKAEMLSR